MDDGRDNNAAGAGGLPPESPQGIFTPQPQVSSEPGAEQGAQGVVDATQSAAGIGASATSYNTHSATSHPYFSSHPTQTYAGSTGDIVIGAPKVKPVRSNRKLFQLGAITLGVVLVIIVLAIAISSGAFTSNDKKVLNLLSTNGEAAIALEDTFATASYGDLNVDDAFSEEMHNKINEQLAKLTALQAGITKIKSSAVKHAAEADLAELQARLNERVAAYQSSVALYNTLYKAYANQTTDGLSDLMNSENYYAAVTAERFYNSITESNELWENINRNNCAGSNGRTDLCQQVLEEYFAVTTSLSSSTSVVAAVFTAYYDGSYANGDRFAVQINNLLEELK